MIKLLDRVLTLIWWVAVAIGSLALVAMIGAVVAEPTNFEVNWFSFQVSEETLEKAGGVAEIPLEDGWTLQVDEATLVSDDPSFAWFAFGMVGAFGALFFVGLHRLRRVVDSAVEGTPFIRANIRRLRELGFVFLGGYLLAGVGQIVAGWVATSRIPDLLAHAGIAMDISPEVLVVPLVFFALAEVFGVGVRLQEEQNLTV